MEDTKVAARIAEILSEKTFSFSPTEYIGIHRRIFNGIYKFAGKIRDHNITKSEPVLDGETVLYASADMLKETLEYEFEQEKKFQYKGLTKQELVEHIAKFISELWQTHAFGEGNTQTTAVFAIKYLRTFGFNVETELFANHGQYFRNALVRANFNDWSKDIHATNEYLMSFFGNLLLNENNILEDNEPYIKFPVKEENSDNSAGIFPVNGKKFLVNGEKLPVIGLDMIKHIEQNPRVTILELAKLLHISDRGVKNNLNKLKAVGVLTRVGSDKTGHWEVLKLS
jgi:fido (protein-threonine AMPylation protein)